MNNVHFRDAVLTATLVCLICALASCSAGVKGTYSDPSGSFVLEVRSGGEATITFGGDTGKCTYTVDGDKLSLDCPGQAKVVFTIHDDGSLTGPPGNAIPDLRKRK